MSTRYPRDLHGYGAQPADARWPENAAIAVQFVLNYEEGGENCLLHGDDASESFLSEISGAAPWPGQRHWNMESIYEYGARAGFWRLYQLFCDAAVPLTVFGVATALERSPAQVEAMLDADWEIASHGLKWIEYRDFSCEQERAHIDAAIRLHTAVTGKPPEGWYTGRCSVNTLDLLCETGKFTYMADSYADDLPYWHTRNDNHHLIVPYTLDANDMRFATAHGFSNADQFFVYLRDTFDVLYEEGLRGRGKMMSIGLHCRLAGRPGRTAALKRFIAHIKAHDRVWLARRIDIARHWHATHPPQTLRWQPSTMSRAAFVETFGGIFEHSPWIAERAFDGELGPAHDTAVGLHRALLVQFRRADETARLDVLRAHPDLAGKLASARRLTRESAREQASAGLDAMSDEEERRFQTLNARYVDKFGFPFILAVSGMQRDEVLAQFEARLDNDRAEEFATACAQVERIARLRLEALFDKGQNA